MIIPNFEDFNSSNCTERSIKLHYPEFYKYIIEHYDCELWSEKLYWYYKGLKEYPKCPICGKLTKFQNLKQGYREFCSNKCLGKSSDIKVRRKQSIQERYGVDNVMQIKEVKEKHKQTCMDKYGVDNVFKSDIVKEKIRQTNRDNLGVDYPMQSKFVRNKSIQTCLDKYDTKYSSQNEYVKEKSKQTFKDKFGGIGFQSKMLLDQCKSTLIEKYGAVEYYNQDWYREKLSKSLKERSLNIHEKLLGYTEDNLWIMKCPHPECKICSEKTYITYSQREYDRLKAGIETCTKLAPINSNLSFIEDFVKNILNEYNIIYENNKIGLIEGRLEIDVYIPSKNIAIECNGVYWHSDKYKDQKYHYNKFIKCQEKGIQLISIWEDQVLSNPEKIRSIILSKLGIYEKRIYARNCIIKEVPSKECNEFLEKYHLQGKTNSSIRLGLYYNNELISIMTFGRGRKCLNSKIEYELYRYCCKEGFQVVGGASKLFKHFVKEYKPETIESFSSNDISDGNLYQQLGFEKVSDSVGYWYIDKEMNRYHRYKFTKYSLVNEGYDKDKTEQEIMNEIGFYRIYDSGQTKWRYENTKF